MKYLKHGVEISFLNTLIAGTEPFAFISELSRLATMGGKAGEVGQEGKNRGKKRTTVTGSENSS